MEKKKMRGEERGRKVEGPPTRVSRGVWNDSSRGTRTSLTETFFLLLVVYSVCAYVQRMYYYSHLVYKDMQH